MAARGAILLVDDETKILNALAAAVRADGHDVVAVTDPREAQRLLTQRLFDVMVVDNLMPEIGGLELIRELVSTTPPSEVPQIIIMTAHATVESAIEAMRLGAFDYLQKPFEIDELLVVVNRALDHQRLRTEHTYLIHERDADFNHYGMVGRSRPMQDVIKTAELVAKTKSTVLITGETGTGKELVARAIHYKSAQREMPLIKVNCAAIPESLLESELFGHVRGAFTGANETKVGLFEHADTGTIFLDEVGELPMSLQAKLLRAVEYGEVQRVGALDTRRADVCVIAATNRDLLSEVADGRFRTDLYYRLGILELYLVPLRDRREDIPYLAAVFIRECSERVKRPIIGITAAAERLLQTAPWPGNVRQLRHVIERACLMTDGRMLSERELQAAMSAGMGGAVRAVVPSRPTAVASGPAASSRLSAAQRDQIQRVLTQVGGNKTAAAHELGISRRSLYRWIDRLDIQ